MFKSKHGKAKVVVFCFDISDLAHKNLITKDQTLIMFLTSFNDTLFKVFAFNLIMKITLSSLKKYDVFDVPFCRQ